MKKRLLSDFLLFFVLVFLLSVTIFTSVFAEDKNVQNSGFAGMIPKLPKTPDDPELFNNSVYPSWGPVCQRYTYTVTYKDKEGRKPEYMRIIFNGKPIEMENRIRITIIIRAGFNIFINLFLINWVYFYYFEASNGLEKRVLQ